ncbi:hypothetical protein [Streptosporangium sp. NBC_01756]|uniref:hypothetical protein n=1 Tax=Streptosporangium sp. NBC_01756 TaxID=2975950 RepID=UPI002DD7C882|nr:hypothetical protein [Streptosporangium sp. NBC_01756]WSC83800.1 hypothetical protein OIE48_25760 [Streptosporangium sp. NBC_01756]
MIAIASASVLVGIERLLFGGSTSSASSSFGIRAFGYVDDFTSPVTVALLVGAVLLAGHLGPVLSRMKLMTQVAVGMLGLAALFGVVGLFGALFSGDATIGRKVEFLLLSVPGLALAVLALLYLLPKVTSAAPRLAGVRAEGGSFRPQEQYAQEQQAYPQGGHAQPVPQQGFQPQEQASQQGYPQGYQPQEQAPQQGYQQGQGFPAQEQASQQGFQPHGQGYPQGGHAQPVPQQGFQPQEQASQQGYPQGYQPQEQAPQQGYQQEQSFQGQGFPAQEQAPQQGFQPQEQAPQGGYQPQGQTPQGGHAQPQAQAAPVPQLPYSQPALPPARSSAATSDGYGQQSAHAYTPPTGDGYSPAAYAPPVETQAPGNQPAPYAQAQLPPPAPAEPYTPSPYVAADAQPSAPAAPYDPPATAYDPPIYATPAEQPQQAPGYPDAQFPGYPPPAAAQHPGYAPPADSPAPGYSPQPEQQQASFYQPQPETYQPQSEAYQPQPETYQPQSEAPADNRQQTAFDNQEQPSFPQPPENYGQPFTGYSGAEFARPTEPNLHYPAPDPVDPRSQQMAQAYQQAESYQQQSQGTEPQLRVPEYGSSPQGGSYDDPFGHPQTPPAAQPYQQSGHQWDQPADATLRFDPSSYQGDPLGGNSWDSQPAIDPTAIYRPERSGQVTGEESPDRERVGPGQEQNMSWYGSDRREP